MWLCLAPTLLFKQKHKGKIMTRKEKDVLSSFYKDCGLELFKLRTKNKLNLIRLSKKSLIPAAKIDSLERGECLEPWTLCKLIAFYGKLIKVELTD